MPLTSGQLAPLLDTLIAPNSVRYGVGMDMISVASSTPTSTAWPAINRALYLPLYIDRPGMVTKFWTLNGAAAAGNVDIGLYDRNYNRLSSTGAIAQAGTNVIQEYDVTDFAIVRGVYFLGLAASLTTTTFFMQTQAVGAVFNGMGITQQASALPLPNPAVPAQQVTTFVPIAGIAFRTLVA